MYNQCHVLEQFVHVLFGESGPRVDDSSADFPTTVTCFHSNKVNNSSMY